VPLRLQPLVKATGAVSGKGSVALPSHAHEERGKSSPFAVRGIDVRGHL